MKAYTPGPWRTGDVFNTVFGPPNGNPCPEVIATVNKGNRANAHLIAAAPDLLAACKSLLETCELNLDELEPETRVAIAEAQRAVERAEGKEA